MDWSQINSLLFVCLGNICRSPTAEAVARAKAREMGLNLTIDSAGTTGHHQGEGPDRRSRAAGERRGIDFSGISSRKVLDEDFAKFDLILAADSQNLADLRARCPAEYQHKLVMIMAFANSKVREVPDPYYGGKDGFEKVLDLLDDAMTGLLGQIALARPNSSVKS
ncbi:low molecular weight phosphotyrosine protein phosphatase [Shewanella avicenniae]|uniref:Low molecular weight phosphotyrosine protein phosphatase n=1 Tax=Shewanella avicenniae TaxID=2814294 RepID=A0ABX7QVI5_9GAMM|nr:low molecular weight protein-tyrosine-phosphatase [Shewanella avicenniae]QSX35439.1 low molecular weight phosphotyrosine protein phosphatase [Shewanella avicenniae]